MIELTFEYPLTDEIRYAHDLDAFLTERGYYLNDDDDDADCATTYRYSDSQHGSFLIVYCQKESLASYLKLLFHDNLVGEHLH